MFKSQNDALLAAIDKTRTQAVLLLSEKQEAVDSLHRQFASLANQIFVTDEKQNSDFDRLQTERFDKFQELMANHTTQVEALKNTYREELGLRAPAEYWASKSKSHTKTSWIFGCLSFGGIGAASVGLAWLVHDLIKNTNGTAPPENWRLALLALVAFFAVWAIRLVVRIFLSSLHLASDASERVVMVKTYLALSEGNQIDSKENRQTILNALFRPATDGIVKDEAAPPGMFEMLSRAPR